MESELCPFTRQLNPHRELSQNADGSSPEKDKLANKSTTIKEDELAKESTTADNDQADDRAGAQGRML